MSDDLVKQAIAELTDVVRCRCNEAYTGRGLHDPDCECDSAEAVKVVADRIEELEAKLSKSEALLAKAVELALEECPFRWGTGIYQDWWHDRRTILAELSKERSDEKGQDDE